jgi:alkaline phosphatase
MLNRRHFLQGLGGGSLALAGLPGIAMGWQAPGLPPVGAKPKRVIFLVADGMSMGALSMAEEFAPLVRSNRTIWAQLLSAPQTAKGFFETHSNNSLVTDSAAAGTAWGSGSRVDNGAINTLPDGTKLTPILKLLKAKGIGTGLVTTTTVTHATPASFAASVASRGSEDDIAPQYLDVVDVILGGGARFFDAATRKDGHDLAADYAAAGYGVVRDRQALLKAGGAEKLLGLFHPGHVPYTVDHRNSPELLESVPTLAEMLQAALKGLHANPNGFVLQVEGGRVDHAAHANDAAGLVWDQLAFDDALAVALAYQAENPDTLVIATSDHGNANPGLNGTTLAGSGRFYGHSTQAFSELVKATGSYDRISARLKEAEAVGAEQVQAAVAAFTGITIPANQAAVAAEAFAGKVDTLGEQHRSFVGVLGQILSNHTGIGWTGTSHTQDYTVISAVGPGQEQFGRLLKNTDFFRIITDLYGISHRNPVATAGLISPASASSSELIHWA